MKILKPKRWEMEREHPRQRKRGKQGHPENQTPPSFHTSSRCRGLGPPPARSATPFLGPARTCPGTMLSEAGKRIFFFLETKPCGQLTTRRRQGIEYEVSGEALVGMFRARILPNMTTKLKHDFCAFSSSLVLTDRPEMGTCCRWEVGCCVWTLMR
jgi:hypothetical protein